MEEGEEGEEGEGEERSIIGEEGRRRRRGRRWKRCVKRKIGGGGKGCSSGSGGHTLPLTGITAYLALRHP